MNPHIKVGRSAHYLFRTFIYYCNTNNTSTILVMEGIRAGWNKAL